MNVLLFYQGSLTMPNPSTQGWTRGEWFCHCKASCSCLRFPYFTGSPLKDPEFSFLTDCKDFISLYVCVCVCLIPKVHCKMYTFSPTDKPHEEEQEFSRARNLPTTNWQPGATSKTQREESSIFGIHFAQAVKDILKKSPLLLGQENLGKGRFPPDAYRRDGIDQLWSG